MRTMHASSLNSWAQFDRKVRFSGRKLLGELDRFKDCILVAGCQRSGTTALVPPVSPLAVPPLPLLPALGVLVALAPVVVR